MPAIQLSACTATPFGSYLKALGVLRLTSEQADPGARGYWVGDSFVLESKFTREELLDFFENRYQPTPILAPWNGGSGFYEKDNKEGIDAIASSTNARFASYREAIATCRAIPEVLAGKGDDEKQRRSAILLHCRNRLSDRAVDWLDAAVGIDKDGTRSFAPVLGTGGNEGRLDYTNNFMSRIAALLIAPDPKTPVRDLLLNALFGERTMALRPAAAGQFDPGRAGGANQGPGIEHDANTNPWDLVLTLEGAVAWASGLYRRHGVAYSAILCSPFTVWSTKVGYSSASKEDDARAEVWTPLWPRPVRYSELRAMLREGRASIQGRPAKNTMEFAEAASSLGVDRGIDRFVRYSLLKRRGDSYVALPAGTFPVRYRSNADLIRELDLFLSHLKDLPKGAEDLRRGVESAMFRALLVPGAERMRELMAAVGRMLRRALTTTKMRPPHRALPAGPWLEACSVGTEPEVRIAAALSSIYTRGIGSITENVSRASTQFGWTGRDLPGRLISVLERRLQTASAEKREDNPLSASCSIHPGDATRFIESLVDDSVIEDLIFAFLVLDWRDFRVPAYSSAEVLPVYATLKCLFLASKIEREGQTIRLTADRRVLSFLKMGAVRDATMIATHRLRVARLRPLDVTYSGGVDPLRLAAALIIPVWRAPLLAAGIFHNEESLNAYA